LLFTKFGHCPTYKAKRKLQSLKAYFKAFQSYYEIDQRKTSLIVLRIFKCDYIIFLSTKCFAFHKNRVVWRKQNGFLKRKNCVNKLARRSAVWPIRQNFLQIVPKKDYYICTSKLQVHCQFYKWHFTSAFASDYRCFKCSYKCSFV
jgi:hypothetical protein